MSVMLAFYFVVYSLQILIMSFVVGLLIKRYVETKAKLILILLSSAFSWLFIIINLLLPVIFTSAGAQYFDYRIVGAIHTVLMVYCPAAFIVFYNAFEGKLSITRISFSVSIVVATIFLTVATLVYNYDSYNMFGFIAQVGNLTSFVWAPLPSILILTGSVMCGIWGYSDLTKSLKHAVSQRQVKQIKLMRIGNILLFFVTVIIATPGIILATLGYVELGIWFAMIITWIFSAAGILIIGIAYSSSKQFAFLQPQRVESLIVIHSSGIPLLEYHFRIDIHKQDTALVSGAITAVRSFMGEAFGIKTDIEEIVFQDKHILLKVKRNVAFILITSRPTVFLSNSLENFATQFCDKHPEIEETFTGETSIFEELIPDLRASFGLPREKS